MSATGGAVRVWTMRALAAIATMTVLGVASSASALILTGGPVYTLPNGGSCTFSGLPCQTGGATLSCTGVNLGFHTHVYFGIRNASNVNGNTMTGVAPAAASSAVFRYSSSTGSSITYTSTTNVNSSITGSSGVNNQLVLTLTGTGSVVAAGGNPADNNNGDIERLFQITGGTSFSVKVEVKASDAFFGLGPACTGVYDPAHATTGAGGDINKVDLAFYYSDCGDGVIDSPEQCDEGSGVNGTPTSCCTSSCTLVGAGQVCRPGSGDSCDLTETCTGLSASCPPDDAPLKLGDVCRTGSGDSCDQNETCTGVPGQTCPPDDAPGNLGVVCRASTVGDFCDESETCTGVPGQTCPPDDAPGKVNVVCRAGSGDICDPDERCTGFPGQGCPADVVSNPTTVCRHGSGDTCDPDEHCTAVPGQACPADVITSAGTTCRPAAGFCDVAEACTGVAGQTCPANGFKPNHTSCNDDNNVCTTDQCDGSGHCTFVSNLSCDDGNVCTQDSCDPTDGCQYTGQPANTCVTASRALFKYKDNSVDAKDSIKFLWRGGPAPVSAMGDPTQTTRYELCVYDSRGVQMAMGVPAGALWKPIGSPSSPKGYKYKDRSGLNDGITLLNTKASNLDTAKAKVKGKGDALPDTAALPFQFPITAQLYADGGMCWEAQFDSADTLKNEAGSFIGRK